MLRVANDYTQLCLHALAHLPLPGPERLDDPRYLAWSERSLPEAARAPLARDAAVIASTGELILQSTPELYGDIAQLRATAALAMTELGEGDVSAPSLLARVRSSEPVELFRACVSLTAPAYAGCWHGELLAECVARLERLREPLEEARRLSSPLRDADVEIGWALGSRGRAFARRILVGVPDDWGALAAERPAVLAMHEAEVREASRAAKDHRYVRAEWAALTRVASTLERASTKLRDAHAAWLAALDLTSVLAPATELGLCDETTRRALVERPTERPTLLARASRI